MYVPVCLLSLVESSDILFVVLLIISLDFPSIRLLNPSGKTGFVVLELERLRELRWEKKKKGYFLAFTNSLSKL